ncbi:MULTISPECIES: UDP-glucuronic acid decarboxylase family protein [unclassified Streptomyces]|uniref:UDP-glucuronic acid decarboxylase family protein n=1 Tax=unclassified Streptomyces TaxID=2593676 RepID=UPI00236652B5|nr:MULTISPECIES: UDP-glucuronic acid decarboxylase family protein [unclassified Streptomyces]MDF3139838.1 SDR family oxidoreductase [Streptomyces sp. T21Q-yed]WDF41896.1 SDR family oxidoreductase [Streptomyces sp. T12]
MSWAQHEPGRERRHIVVTGGAGFLGSHLCERLLERGYEVTCMDNFSTGSMENLSRCLEDPHFTLLEMDVTEKVWCHAPVTAVAHLACPASPQDYLRLPLETLRACSLGTLNALTFAQEKGARFLYASTSETYGDPEVHPQPENYWGRVNPVGPRSVYDEGKRFGESATMTYLRYHGLSAGIVRIFNTYGPRMRTNDGRAVPAFVTQALRGERLTVYGTGTQTRSFCYVDDLVTGLVHALESDHAGPINLGNPTEVTILELARLVADISEAETEISYGPAMQDDPVRRKPDISYARELLGWSPTVSLEEGLRRTIEWFKAAVL